MYLKRVTAEVSSTTAPQKGCPFRSGGPQGLRRPRFSFFRFTCQTARKPGGFHSPMGREADEAKASDHNRMPVPAISEELRRRAIAPVSGRRAVWTGLYGRPNVVVNRKPLCTLLVARPRLQRLSQFSRFAVRQLLRLAPHLGHIPPPFLARRAWGILIEHRLSCRPVRAPDGKTGETAAY